MAALVANAAPRFPSIAGSAVVVGTAGLAALVAKRSLAGAIVLALLPAVALLKARPVPTAILGVGLVPLTADLAPGLSLKVSLWDALLLLALRAAIGARRSDWTAVKSFLPLIARYALTLLPALAANLEPAILSNAAQVLQIALVPLLVGAVVLRRAGPVLGSRARSPCTPPRLYTRWWTSTGFAVRPC